MCFIYCACLLGVSGILCDWRLSHAAKTAEYGLDFNLFLKSLVNPDGTAVWSVTALNLIPIGGYSLQSRLIILPSQTDLTDDIDSSVIAVWTFAIGSDWFGTRWVMILIQCVGDIDFGLISAE